RDPYGSARTAPPSIPSPLRPPARAPKSPNGRVAIGRGWGQIKSPKWGQVRRPKRLSRKRLDFHLLDAEGGTVAVGAAPPDADGLRGLTERIDRHGAPIRAAIESMNGARFVHDRLELAGWQVEIADAQKVKGLAPLACKTDRIDAWVLAELARRELVPAIWLPDPQVRAE